MRKINKIIVHCSATPPDMDIGAEEIKEWHLDRGFSDVGYHAVIRQSGKIEKGRYIGKQGAHVRGHNRHSIGVCLVGGLDPGGNPDGSGYSREQMKSLRKIIDILLVFFPGAQVLGHNNLTDYKECPCMDIPIWYYG